jgi:glutamate/tyrosine decarboxylase-like PLP-dependent enzyme
MDEREAALDRAHRRALGWLRSLEERDVPARATIEEVAASLGTALPEHGTEAAEVVDLLATACDPGLAAIPSGRFFGFVMGGTHPAALAADWLVSAWDQNSGMRRVTPAHSAVEDLASSWVLQLLGLSEECAVGFVTGGTMANFTGLAAGRDAVLRRAGWDVTADGLHGGPRVRVLVGAERHDTVDLSLRYLGLGTPELVPVDDQGRIRPDALRGALADGEDAPTIVVLQAGNVHSGAFDPFGPAVEAAHTHGAWVHVDGAFGLWAATSPAHRELMAGAAAADSWATDAHKTLNVPYDCGLAIVRDRAALTAAMGMHGDYLVHDEMGEPFDKVPEISRRGRAFPVWAVLRALGSSGVERLVDRLCGHAARFADGIAAIPGAEVLNDVCFTQVCASFGSDERTQAVVQAMLDDGTAWMTGSRWHGRSVLRVSVSSWATTGQDVERSLEALRRAVTTAP